MPWPSLLVNVAETSLSLRSGLDEESHRDLLASLKRDSQALYSVSLNFMKHAAGIKIISCYEQMPTPPQSECVSRLRLLILGLDTLISRQCINEHTGGLGLPGEKLIPMAGCDHRSVACFSSRDDEKYRLVVHEIKKVVRASAKSMSASPSLPANRRVQGEHAPWNGNNLYLCRSQIPSDVFCRWA